MIKEIIIGLVILAYVIPFVYIIVADIADVFKRISTVSLRKLIPAIIPISKSRRG